MASQFTRGKYRDEDRVIAPALEAIEAAWDVLVALPDRDSTTFFRTDDHLSAIANRDDESVVWHFFWDAYNWLKLFGTALPTRLAN